MTFGARFAGDTPRAGISVSICGAESLARLPGYARGAVPKPPAVPKASSQRSKGPGALQECSKRRGSLRVVIRSGL